MDKIILKCACYQKLSNIPFLRTGVCDAPVKLFSTVAKTESISRAPVFSKKSAEYGFGKKYAVKNLEQLLDIKKITALDIANKYKKLSLVNGKTMTANLTLCKEAGISRDTLLKYPEILAQKSLQYKLGLLKQLPFDINTVAPLLNMETKSLKGFVESYSLDREEYGEGGRIGYLSELLHYSAEEVCDILQKKPFLRTISLARIMSNIETLLDYGITTEDIKRDLWVLRYKAENIRQRLDTAKDINIDKIKTWMVRCKPEIFEIYVKRRIDNKQILGNNSVTEYLAERLNCTVEEAKVLISKQPALEKKRMKKIKEVLDFLFAQGFQPYQICRVPKILLHSVETTKKRLKELEPYGRHLDSLYVMTKSKKQYMQFYETLVKSCKKIKTTS